MHFLASPLFSKLVLIQAVEIFYEPIVILHNTKKKNKIQIFVLISYILSTIVTGDDEIMLQFLNKLDPEL